MAPEITSERKPYNPFLADGKFSFFFFFFESSF